MQHDFGDEERRAFRPRWAGCATLQPPHADGAGACSLYRGGDDPVASGRCFGSSTRGRGPLVGARRDDGAGGLHLFPRAKSRDGEGAAQARPIRRGAGRAGRRGDEGGLPAAGLRGAPGLGGGKTVCTSWAVAGRLSTRRGCGVRGLRGWSGRRNPAGAQTRFPKSISRRVVRHRRGQRKDPDGAASRSSDEHSKVWSLGRSRRMVRLSARRPARRDSSLGTGEEDLRRWRRRPDLNRGWRFCRPLPYHLATAPYLRAGETLVGG